MTDLRLPGGWAWATNPHDIRQGIAVAKVWWHKDVPFVRCQVGTQVDRAGGRRTFGWLSYAAARRVNRGRNPWSRSQWQWRFVVEVPELPPDPLAAAMVIELDFEGIRAAVLKGAKDISRSSVLDRPLWEVVDG